MTVSFTLPLYCVLFVIFHSPVSCEYSTSIFRRAKKPGWSRSNMNCLTVSGSIHVAPRRTSISEASRSTGCAARRASSLQANAGSFFAARSASASFSRTFPERYSSAGTNTSGLSGRRKITPRRSVSSSSSVFPESADMYSISTRAFSDMETARASAAVSTCSTARWGWIVRCVKISAFRSSWRSSFRISSEHSK